MKQENSQFMDQIGKLDEDVKKTSENVHDSNEIKQSVSYYSLDEIEYEKDQN